MPSIPPSLPSSSSPKIPITLTGSPTTLLVTLYSRHLDRSTPKPLLNDPWSTYVLSQLDFDFSTLGINGFFGAVLTHRTLLFDVWTREWLDKHQEKGKDVTVLHLGVGLDARGLRVGWQGNDKAGEGTGDGNIGLGDRMGKGRGGGRVRWIDVDLPEVIELRTKLLPKPEVKSGMAEYTLLAGDVTDPSLLSRIPNDRPTLVIMEGLLPYLEPADAEGLISRLTSRFGSTTTTSHRGENQLVFDCCGWAMVAMQRWTAVFKGAVFLKTAKAEWKYAVDDPKGLEGLGRGMRLLDDVLATENEGLKEMPGKWQWIAWVMARLPGLRYTSRYMRYAF